MFIISIFLIWGEIEASLLWPISPTLAVIILSPVNLVSKLVRRHASRFSRDTRFRDKRPTL